jgi:hypothetical protein
MGLERMAGLVKIAQFWQLIWLNGEQKDHPVSITPGQARGGNLSAWFVKGAVAAVLERLVEVRPAGLPHTVQKRPVFQCVRRHSTDWDFL